MNDIEVLLQKRASSYLSTQHESSESFDVKIKSKIFLGVKSLSWDSITKIKINDVEVSMKKRVRRYFSGQNNSG